MERIIKELSSNLGIEPWQVENVINLIEEGNTIPFIARYRKEKTGNLSDEMLRDFSEKYKYALNLKERKEDVIRLIDEGENLTKELEEAILNAKTLTEVEDLYRPYKPKKKTRGSVARERGLEALGLKIFNQKLDRSVEEEAKEFIDPEKDVNTIEDAIAGALDIIAEEISDSAEIRKFIRGFIYKNSQIKTSIKEDGSVYEMYSDFSENLKSILPHRVLAINRGEKEKVISVKIDDLKEEVLDKLNNKIIRNNIFTEEYVKNAIKDSYTRLIFPSIEREIRSELTEKAEEKSIEVFKKNLSKLLMGAPVKGKTVLGWDPGFRTGCKIAVCDEKGEFLDYTVIHPTEPTTEEKIKKSKEVIHSLIKKYNVDLIALGNGTASRESEAVIMEIIEESPREILMSIVNEAGASVYSASKEATKEYPNLDVGARSALSLAHRLQDPMGELVKIDPKSIGIGQYQHDMNQKKLGEALDGTVEDCVNRVGVDANLGSSALLSYVSGISSTIADNIIEYRKTVGEIKNRKELLKVKGLGPKAFLQCAGFIRIMDGDEILDSTAVHPEAYEKTYKLLDSLNIDKTDIKEIRRIGEYSIDVKALSSSLDIGEETLRDIIKELEKPGRDVRENLQGPILKKDVLDISHIKVGMILEGTVRNAIDFGAFIDIGVHQDGLVHISEISDKYIKHPTDVVNVGDIVKVKVLDVDEKKGRIALSMKL